VKQCPFCAEEIQDAAIVCKHCGRALDGSVAPAKKAKTRWGRILLVVGGLFAIPVLAMYCSEDHQRFLAFSARRDAWHQKCDTYINVPNNRLNAAGLVCLQEFEALQAYAKQQGW
jgi:hypothetical protein